MTTEIKLAFYQRHDWEKLMKSIVDRSSMHDTWDEWHQEYLRIKKRLLDQGFVVHDMTINVNDLDNFCSVQGLANDGKTRSLYANSLPLTDKKKN